MGASELDAAIDALRDELANATADRRRAILDALLPARLRSGYEVQRVGDTVRVTLKYPGVEGHPKRVQVDIESVNPVYSIRARYDAEREAWRIEQTTKFRHQLANDEEHEWTEVAMIRTFGFHEPRGEARSDAYDLGAKIEVLMQKVVELGMLRERRRTADRIEATDERGHMKSFVRAPRPSDEDIKMHVELIAALFVELVQRTCRAT